MLPIAINTLLVIHVLVSLLIIFLVLMQRPKNEGLGAAFGGGMTENLFGAQTTNVLQTITRWLGGIFFALTLLLSWLYVKQTTWRSSVQQKLSAPTMVPAAPAPPAGAASGAIPAPTDPVLPSDVSAPVSLPTPTPGAANTPATAAPQNPATPAATPLEKSSETPAPGSPAPVPPATVPPAQNPPASPAQTPGALNPAPAPSTAPAQGSPSATPGDAQPKPNASAPAPGPKPAE